MTETYTGIPTLRTTIHTSDAFDRMESITDRCGLILSYTYDANGNLPSGPAKLSGANGEAAQGELQIQ